MLVPILRWTHRHVKGLRKSQGTTLGYLVAGWVDSGCAGVAAIGHHLPDPAFAKHKIKRVDRYLGNGRVDRAVVSQALWSWATESGSRLLWALDRTDLPPGKKMLSLSVPGRGQALPVHLRVVDERRMWKSQNNLEKGLIKELLTLLPSVTRPVLLADRGFGRTRLMQQLKGWGVSFVLRVQGVAIARSQGRKHRLQTIPLRRGQTVWLRRVLYRDEEPVEVNVVLTWWRRMKEAWTLVTGLEDPPHTIIAYCGRRMQIEESFRDSSRCAGAFACGMYD